MTDRFCRQLLETNWPEDTGHLIGVLDDLIRRLRPRVRRSSATPDEIALYDQAMIARAILRDERAASASASASACVA